MTESQEKTKLAYESFECFFNQFKPFDYYSKMVLEIFFKVALEKRYGKGLPLPYQEEQE
jgi:hypothetical protein